MKRSKKVILVIFCIIIVMVGTVFGMEKYNEKKYGKAEPGDTKDVTDLSNYPTDIDGVNVKYVDNKTFQGFHLSPTNRKYKGIVICYGGSEGSPAFDVAEKYAKEGYETLSVFMFGMKNQHEKLTKIPLEQFEDVLEYANGIEDHDPISIWAASKGSEYALYLASKYDDISGLVLTAPSAYSFSGLDFNDPGASWTWEGKEVPCIDIMKTPLSVTFKSMILPMIVEAPVAYKEVYDAALAADPQRDEKLIPVQDIKADILLIVGKDDQMWGSYDMAQIIKSKNSNAVICAYEDAGHSFRGNGVVNQPGMRIRLGGTIEGNEKARAESGKKVEEFLKEHHGR